VTTGAPPRTAGGYLRFLLQVIALAIALGLLGALPTRRLAGEGALPALVAGCAIGVLASALGAAPVALRLGGAQAALASMALRFAVALGLGLAAALSGLFARGPLLVWVAISYMALLVADTRYALSALGRPAQGSAEKMEKTENVEKR